jgi:hypothetical protein
MVAFHEPGRPDYSGQQFFWKEVLNAPGATQMRHVRTLIESRSQLIRVPDQSLLASEAGSGLSHVRATRAADGSYAFVYVPDGRSVSIHMNKLKGKQVQAGWFDPRHGGLRSLGRFTAEGMQDFDAPGSTRLGNDWVLVLDSLPTDQLDDSEF